jgi:hypothetical protein
MLRSGDTWTLLSMGSTLQRHESTESLRTMLRSCKEYRSDDAMRSATDVNMAMQAARLTMHGSAVGRVVLLTDARSASADTADAIDQLCSQAMELFTDTLACRSEPGLAIASLTANPGFAH